ncbi:hypothetical protein C5B86_05430 [Haloferax sp. Atlit-19N]|uniref:hypothetical protein n=1 Tax=Haloferax sp. Atlit-19N TaxID=2077201 RepID=UPI000E2301E4|nr:hypothetical protein [Haloferax sp. Atlit-19N]RDZ48482.1 hypothetical protein C5B86_05430 [Haloferax sp. Atlit-19N]
MSNSASHPTERQSERAYRTHPLGVRIVEYDDPDGDGRRYGFRAPDHAGREFDDPDTAALYADVYFDVNGFVEAGTGDRGVPPEVIQAGRDTLAAYFLTQPYADADWVASFYGKKRARIERYTAAVRRRAEEIREGVEALEREGNSVADDASLGCQVRTDI